MPNSHFLLPFREKQKVTKKISAIALTLALVSSLVLLLIPSVNFENLIDLSLIYLTTFIFFIIFGGQFFRTIKLNLPAMIIIFFLGLPTFFNQNGIELITFTIGSLKINLFMENMIKAIFIWLRGLYSVSLITLYSTCLTLQEFIQSLRSLFLPQLMVTIILLILRYSPMFYQQGIEIRTAQKMRGIELASRNKRFAAASAMMGGIIIKSIKHGDEIYEAMLLRGMASSDLIRRGKIMILDPLILLVFVIIISLFSGGLL